MRDLFRNVRLIRVCTREFRFSIRRSLVPGGDRSSESSAKVKLDIGGNRVGVVN